MCPQNQVSRFGHLWQWPGFQDIRGHIEGRRDCILVLRCHPRKLFTRWSRHGASRRWRDAPLGEKVGRKGWDSAHQYALVWNPL